MCTNRTFSLNTIQVSQSFQRVWSPRILYPFEWEIKVITAKLRVCKNTNKRSLQPHWNLPNNSSDLIHTHPWFRSFSVLSNQRRTATALPSRHWVKMSSISAPSLLSHYRNRSSPTRSVLGEASDAAVPWRRQARADRTSSQGKGALGQSLHCLWASVYRCTAEKREGSSDELSWTQFAQNTLSQSKSLGNND